MERPRESSPEKNRLEGRLCQHNTKGPLAPEAAVIRGQGWSRCNRPLPIWKSESTDQHHHCIGSCLVKLLSSFSRKKAVGRRTPIYTFAVTSPFHSFGRSTNRIIKDARVSSVSSLRAERSKWPGCRPPPPPQRHGSPVSLPGNQITTREISHAQTTFLLPRIKLYNSRLCPAPHCCPPQEVIITAPGRQKQGSEKRLAPLKYGPESMVPPRTKRCCTTCRRRHGPVHSLILSGRTEGGSSKIDHSPSSNCSCPRPGRGSPAELCPLFGPGDGCRHR